MAVGGGPPHEWNFAKAFLYSLTVLTTIGKCQWPSAFADTKSAMGREGGGGGRTLGTPDSTREMETMTPALSMAVGHKFDVPATEICFT